jgi:hypothetical protein
MMADAKPQLTPVPQLTISFDITDGEPEQETPPPQLMMAFDTIMAAELEQEMPEPLQLMIMFEAIVGEELEEEMPVSLLVKVKPLTKAAAVSYLSIVTPAYPDGAIMKVTDGPSALTNRTFLPLK